MIVHKPVLLKEVLEYLQPGPGRHFVDCTVGSGGHAEAILEASGETGKLLGIDWDADAIARSADRLGKFGKRVILVNDSYVNIKKIIADKSFKKVHGIVIDLGFSLNQIQDSGRGFSFQYDEPLDMRYSLDNHLTAAKILNDYSEEQLARIFRDCGEEPEARKIARRIVEARKEKEITRTIQLVQIILNVKKRRTKIHPATKIFQALRITVNDELNNIMTTLKDFLDIVEVGGRVVVISFHSLEDRIVKRFFQQEAKGCLCAPEVPVCSCAHLPRVKILTKKPVQPTEKEIEENFRSRSAKLRAVERIL